MKSDPTHGPCSHRSLDENRKPVTTRVRGNGVWWLLFFGLTFAFGAACFVAGGLVL